MDCLIIGYNDLDFSTVVDEVKSMGEENVAYRDLNLNFVELDGKPFRALDVLNQFFECAGPMSKRPFRNHDLLWPAIPPIASFLHNKDCSFDYINNFNVDKELLKSKLLNDEILTIAITTTIYIADSPILEIVSFIRQFNQTAKIVVGGPYMSKQTEEKEDMILQAFLKYLGADIYVFSKEGEYALYRIIQALKGEVDFDAIDNIGYLQHGRYIITPAKGEDNPLDKHPINYSLFPSEAIGEYVNVKTSKSCPFECSFCAFPLRAERYVYTDERWIISQLNEIRNVGTVKNVFFSDDTFNIPLTRFKNLMRMMIAEKYHFRWHCFYRCGNSDEEAIVLMKEAGCTGVFLGIESANDNILSIMNKKSRRIDYATALPMFRKHGILTFASIFVGFPGETYESYNDTMEFIEETKPDFCRPLVWYCDTTTPIWRDREKYGIKGNSFNWSHNTMNSREACDLMEESFMSLKAPTVYVPDPGFNFISIYYLLQRGFTVDQVKSFLTCFSNAVKVKMLFPGNHNMPDSVLENLKRSCNVSGFSSNLDNDIIDKYSGETYEAALRFWIAKFEGYQFLSKLLKADMGKAELDAEINVELYHNHLLGVTPLSNKLTLVSAVLFLLSYLEGYSTIAVLYVSQDGSFFPLKIDIEENCPFDEFKCLVSQELKECQKYRDYGFHVLANPYRLKKYKLEIPNIKFAFFDNSADDRQSIAEVAESFPDIAKNIGLSFSTIGSIEGKVQMSLSYNTAVLHNVDQIRGLLRLTLEQVITNSSIRLSDIRFGKSDDSLQTRSMQSMQKQFKF